MQSYYNAINIKQDLKILIEKNICLQTSELNAVFVSLIYFLLALISIILYLNSGMRKMAIRVLLKLYKTTYSKVDVLTKKKERGRRIHI